MFFWNRNHYMCAYGISGINHRFPSAQICQHSGCIETATVVWKEPPDRIPQRQFAMCSQHVPHDTGDENMINASNVRGGWVTGNECRCAKVVANQPVSR